MGMAKGGRPCCGLVQQCVFHTCLKFSLGFCLGLSALQRHDGCNVIRGGDNGVVPRMQHGRALLARACRPLRKACRCLGDCSPRFDGTHVGDTRDDVAGCRVVHVKRGTVAGSSPVTPDKPLCLEQCLVGHQLEQVLAQGGLGGFGLRRHARRPKGY